MGKNKLFQQARHFVQLAVNNQSADESEQQQAIKTAQNALSSAYANTTISQQKQLRELQEQLDQIK